MRQLAPVRDSDRLDVATNQIRATTPRPPPPRQLRPPATALPLSVGRPFAFAWNESSDTAVLPFASQINCIPPAKANNCSFKMEVIFCVQGAISPLLSNIALGVIEERYERWAYHRAKLYPHRKCDGVVAAARTRAADRSIGRCVFLPVRYADDFILLVSGTKEEALAEKSALAKYLRETTGLELSAE